MKKIIIVLTALMIMSLFVISGPQAIAAEKTYNWKMAHYHPSGTMLDKVSRKFIENVKELSNGRINIKLYPGELLGDYIVQQEAVQSGSLELAYTSPVTKTSPKWNIYQIGYTGWNIDQAKEKFGPGGWMLEIFDEIAYESNWKILDIAPGGSVVGGESIISTKSFDPTDPKGLKLRVLPSDILVTKWSALGYNPIMIPFSEVSSALALGTIDASAGCIPQEFAIFGEAFNYAYALQDTQTVLPLIMNLDLWNSLSKEDQNLLLEASNFSEDPEYGWDGWKEAIEVSYNEELLPWQIIVTIDGDQWATLAEIAREAEWVELEKTVGKELMDKVRASVPDLPWGLTLDEMNYGWGEVLTTEWLIERQGAVYNSFPPEVKK